MICEVSGEMGVPYSNENPLVLEVDIGDGELVTERHVCGCY